MSQYDPAHADEAHPVQTADVGRALLGGEKSFCVGNNRE